LTGHSSPSPRQLQHPGFARNVPARALVRRPAGLGCSPRPHSCDTEQRAARRQRDVAVRRRVARPGALGGVFAASHAVRRRGAGGAAVARFDKAARPAFPARPASRRFPGGDRPFPPGAPAAWSGELMKGSPAPSRTVEPSPRRQAKLPRRAHGSRNLNCFDAGAARALPCRLTRRKGGGLAQRNLEYGAGSTESSTRTRHARSSTQAGWPASSTRRAHSRSTSDLAVV
jgi:hypothetical protein